MGYETHMCQRDIIMCEDLLLIMSNTATSLVKICFLFIYFHFLNNIFLTSFFSCQPFRSRMQMDRGSVEQKWSTLSRAIDEIVLRNSSQLSFEELYRNSYNLVIQKHGRMLYDNVTQKISQH